MSAMISTENPEYGKQSSPIDAWLVLSLLLTLFLATLTLWIPAYWPVALFEISAFLIAGNTHIYGQSA